MQHRSGNIYLYYCLTLTAWVKREMKVDDTAVLSELLRQFQEDGTSDQVEARLAIALTRVVENSIRPSLVMKLRPQDIDDICSEIILNFWKFRHSVRPDEAGKLIQTLKKRRMTDQVRKYYKEHDHSALEAVSDEAGLLALLPARSDVPGTEAGQDVWDLLSMLELDSKDQLVSYMVYLGAEKGVIASILKIDPNTVTNSVKRCREALLKRGYGKPAGNSDD